VYLKSVIRYYSIADTHNGLLPKVHLLPTDRRGLWS